MINNYPKFIAKLESIGQSGSLPRYLKSVQIIDWMQPIPDFQNIDI